jgi:hypothetical protein
MGLRHARAGSPSQDTSTRTATSLRSARALVKRTTYPTTTPARDAPATFTDKRPRSGQRMDCCGNWLQTCTTDRKRVMSSAAWKEAGSNHAGDSHSLQSARPQALRPGLGCVQTAQVSLRTLKTCPILTGKGRIVPTASNSVQFSVSGPGNLLGVGNGDPSCDELDKAEQRSAFNGLCMAIVQYHRIPGASLCKPALPDLSLHRLRYEARAPQPVPSWNDAFSGFRCRIDWSKFNPLPDVFWQHGLE